MLMGCGVEKTGESGSVEVPIRYCFFIEFVPMFVRIKLPVTVAIPIFTLMNDVQATMIGRVVRTTLLAYARPTMEFVFIWGIRWRPQGEEKKRHRSSLKAL